jgi:cytochrome c nitrite reductase small subunit
MPRIRTRHWAIAAAIAVGLAVGLGAFTFVYARGASYLTNDPAACANCHIMGEHYAAWLRASHRALATCNDCHTPHDPIGKYLTKARNGFWHSFYFTTGNFPDPLRITETNRVVTEQACRHCHGPIVDAIDPAAHGGARASAPSAAPQRAGVLAQGGGEGTPRAPSAGEADRLSCVRCHRHVGHWVR